MSTLADMKTILNNLRVENNPQDLELIKYYERMIPEWTVKAYDKAIKNIGLFRVTKK